MVGTEESFGAGGAIPVTPPEGVAMHKLGMDEQEGRRVNRFGLYQMSHGIVAVDPGGPHPIQHIRGTYLQYEQGNYHAQVIRRDLSASEINRIGELILSLDENDKLRNLADGVLSLTNQAVDRLRVDTGARMTHEFHAKTDELDSISLKAISDRTGVDKSIVQDKRESLQKEHEKLMAEARSLGVSQFSWFTHNGEKSLRPVKKLSEEDSKP
jgi:hypothetical protein